MRIKRHRYAFLLISAAATISAGCAAFDWAADSPDPFIRYSISLEDAGLNIIRVSASVYGAATGPVTFVRPSRDSTIDPIALAARDLHGEPLAIRETDGGWRIENKRRDFTFSYDLVLTVEDRYTPEVGWMLTMLEEDRCRILGKDIFLVPAGVVSSGVLVDVELFPDQAIRSAYGVNSRRMIIPAVKDIPAAMAVSGRYRYLELVIGSTEFRFAIAGGWKFGDEEFFDVIHRIVSCEMGMFDSSPHESFLFVCDRNPVKGNEGFDNYGLHIGRNIILLLDGKLDRSELYGPSMSIVAHEFFHNWNGEAIWPRTSDFLWFTEGATVYYSYQVLLDANIITPSQYERQRNAIIQRYRDNAHLDSIPIVRAANSDLGDKDLVNLLYDGGFLAAEALDRRIEQVSGGSVSLIDVLNWMHENARDGADVSVLAEAVSHTTGYDLSDFLGEMILDPAPDVLAHN
jgi:predicted metalloprotease with PDZ domain